MSFCIRFYVEMLAILLPQLYIVFSYNEEKIVRLDVRDFDRKVTLSLTSGISFVCQS